MDLCTVISQKYIPQALNLIKSYNFYSDKEKVFVYYFNTAPESLKIFNQLFGNQVVLRQVEEICPHALDPLTFVYKAYAINDCLLNHSRSMIYSDSANCFIKTTEPLQEDLVDNSLLMSYPHHGLTNEYWTTKKCFEKLESPAAEIMPQYWAGFQVYQRTPDNILLVTELLNYLKDPDVALPNMKEKRPDGAAAKCIEHRCDQSVLSLLIHKHNRHQLYDPEKTLKYGDWQTIVEFDRTYRPDFSKRVLAPRESKFGQFRFLNARV
tara:strand:+ start:6304 stop:7101 length:798 start_codon:yes stop_codon:yes gene_type:complete